ncbi:MAG: hypothetical protein H0U34_05135, partial [Sphingomonas sp.]|nr:hypothetical protein [Sphingomonas sp.]
MGSMTEKTKTGATAMPSLEDWQHWTWVMGRAQQMLMETWAEGLKTAQPAAATAPPAWGAFPPAFGFGGPPAPTDPMAMMKAGAEAWAKGLETWGQMVGLDPASKAEAKDRRFSA